jgi:5-formyltetrahydrofolate cyclo-ligase
VPGSGSTDDSVLAERKRALRARMRAVTRVIASAPARRAERSAVACRRLIELVEAHDPHRVMVFDSWRTEVDLAVFVTWCTEQGHDVFRPRLEDGGIVVDPGHADHATLDVVVVPGMAFTASGDRLGRGGGHYDRFLARLRPSCVTVGVVFAEQVVDSLPTGPHDVRVGTVIAA